MQRQLHDRHVGLRIGAAQRHPGAVVEAATGIHRGGMPGLLQQPGGALRELR